jgi:hypothetical protein
MSNGRVQYSKLSIVEKINVKAKALAKNIAWDVDLHGWMPIMIASADFTYPEYIYSSPFGTYYKYTNKTSTK